MMEGKLWFYELEGWSTEGMKERAFTGLGTEMYDF